MQLKNYFDELAKLCYIINIDILLNLLNIKQHAIPTGMYPNMAWPAASPLL